MSHAKDVELAAACARGDESAWERFVREYRPILYRAADALDAAGRAREIADALYADLYGVREGRERQSLFRYYQGRSSLATWLRAVLAQRYVDLVRAERRHDPLPDEEALAPASDPVDPDRARHAAAFERALSSTLSDLDARDRLRLGCYYAQQLTLAETGRLLGESEATSSRQLARTRAVIRERVDALLDAAGLSPEDIVQCYAAVTEDVGAIDLGRLLGARKKLEPDRSV